MRNTFNLSPASLSGKPDDWRYLFRWRGRRRLCACPLDCRRVNSESLATNMSEPEPAKATSPDKPADTFKIVFTKAPFFRSVLADASWGRISPSGYIHLSFFNDCIQLPALETHTIEAGGKLSPMNLSYPIDANVVRQIEVDVIMSLESAKSVRDTLQNFVEILEKQIEKQQPAS
jgi:hypothetical protein